MKVAVFSYVYAPEQFLINELCENFVKKKHDVFVVTGLPNYPKGEFYQGYNSEKGPFFENINGVDIYRYKIRERKKGFKNLAINYLTHIWGANKKIKSLPKADIVFVFATSPITTAIAAIKYARKHKLPIIIWLQDLWPDSVFSVGATKKNSLMIRVLKYLVKYIYKNTDIMLIQSEGFKNNLKDYQFSGDVHWVPNWGSSEISFDGDSPSWLSDFPKNFTITFAGNLGKAQSLDTIVDAANLLRNEDVSFVIVGDGSDKNNIEEKIHNLNLKNFKFYGKRPVQDMGYLFKKSSALIVSLRDETIFSQTIPSKVQAYMMAGKPIIASLNGSGKEIVERFNCGVTAQAENSKELADSIKSLLNLSKEEQMKLGANGKEAFDLYFSFNKVSDQIESIMKGAIH